METGNGLPEPINWLKQDPKKIKVADLETGRGWLTQVQTLISRKMDAMRNPGSDSEFKAAQNEHYHLILVRRAIQTSMGKIVKQTAQKPTL